MRPQNGNPFAAPLAIFLILFVLFYVLDCASSRPVSAQEPVNRETQLLLAQTFVLEANFEKPRDHVAIAFILKRKADRHRIDFNQLIRKYASGFKISTPRTRWIRDLNFEATKPTEWPLNLSWSAHVDRWLEALARAAAFLQGKEEDPCHGLADEWGMREGIDLQRAIRANWTEVDCGETANAFWSH